MTPKAKVKSDGHYEEGIRAVKRPHRDPGVLVYARVQRSMGRVGCGPDFLICYKRVSFLPVSKPTKRAG